MLGILRLRIGPCTKILEVLKPICLYDFLPFLSSFEANCEILFNPGNAISFSSTGGI
jgi:hypothetical protein